MERAAERGARGAVEAATVTATATLEAAEVARRAQLERDVREDRRADARRLADKAAAREQIYRQVLGAISSDNWDFARMDGLSDQLAHETTLENRDQYVGAGDAVYHNAVQAYYKADLACGGGLFAVRAMQIVVDAPSRPPSGAGPWAEYVSSRSFEAELVAEWKEKYGREYEARFKELHDAVLTLHRETEPYVRRA